MPNLVDVLSDTTLYSAWIKVLENQGCAGIDGISLDDFSNGLWIKLEALAQEVQNNKYRAKALCKSRDRQAFGWYANLSYSCHT